MELSLDGLSIDSQPHTTESAQQWRSDELRRVNYDLLNDLPRAERVADRIGPTK